MGDREADEQSLKEIAQEALDRDDPGDLEIAQEALRQLQETRAEHGGR